MITVVQIVTQTLPLHNTLWICEPGWEVFLCAELARTAEHGQHEIVSPGWVRSQPWHEDARSPSIALAAQCLPAAIELEAPSIAVWARLVGAAIVEDLRDHAGPWRLHVFSRYPPGDRRLYAGGHFRGELIRANLIGYLRRKQRRLLRSLTPDPTAPWLPEELLVQLGWMGPTRGALSFCSAEDRQRLRRVVSRFPVGEVSVPDEPQAPSRAYRKLAEVQLRLNRPIAAGERCVDLGSSPGGWAWLALERGARVTAIDRSPLREDLMHHERLRFISGDAFKYLPEEPVDWLLSDVIAFPERALALLQRWLGGGWCRQFCVTIKFRGQDEYPRLEEFKFLLSSLQAEYCLRRLTHNRNEVTAYGYAAGVAPNVPGLC